MDVFAMGIMWGLIIALGAKLIVDGIEEKVQNDRKEEEERRHEMGR